MQPGLGIHGQKPAKAGNFPSVIHYTQRPCQHQVLHPSIPSFLLRTRAGRKFKRAVGGSERKQQNHPGKAQEPLQNWYLAEITQTEPSKTADSACLHTLFSELWFLRF